MAVASFRVPERARVPGEMKASILHISAVAALNSMHTAAHINFKKTIAMLLGNQSFRHAAEKTDARRYII